MGNVPGASVIDSPLWMGRLEGLCQKLLGELLLKTLPALWLGGQMIERNLMRSGPMY